MLRTVTVCALILLALNIMAPAAKAETRSLKLYYTHTGEKAEIVFKRNGRYDQGGLKKLNRFLRDWRRNEPTSMDPKLFDLVWEVYKRSGSNNYIHVVSAYRAPATNDMLRRTRGGQAKKSQHMVGKAMDFFIPGVKSSKLREIGMKLQSGGVGYYPSSGSPYVHLDVGGVRAWPRMSRQQLAQLFPDGKTIHLPPDGKPLPGYQAALADYKKRGGSVPSSGGGSGGGGKNLFAALFGGGDEDEPEDTPAAASSAPASAPTRVAALAQSEAPAPAEASANAVVLPETAPVPLARPQLAPESGTQVALVAPPAAVPGQAQIDAFSAAAALVPATPVAEATAAAPDLSRIKAPVPQLLAERVPQPTEATEVAALGGVAQDEVPVPANLPEEQQVASLSPQDSFVPLPIRRPGDRSSDALALAAIAQTPDTTPAETQVASLETAVAIPARSEGEPAAAAEPAVNIGDPVLASLATLPASGDGGVASAFAPVPKGARKGARPGADEAGLGRPSVRRTEPKLTEKIISQWALDRDRVKTMSDPSTKGKRFVSAQLRVAPREVYAVGFTPEGRSQPHSRFTGAAVNFIEVARFGPSS